MHWTERRRARVNLALGLQSCGWTLFGFKEDRSEAMTDYYDPASWDGIAEKDVAGGPCVVIVDLKPTNETILKRSGGYKASKRVPGDDCPHCDSTGQEPDGWTYERAKIAPREFNLDRTSRQTPGAVPLMAHVVSPLHFDEQGREKCVKCNGLGHTWKLEEVTVECPEFQANPARKLWHVECDGRILDSGIGLGPCADWDREKARAAVERIVNRIEAAIQGQSTSTTTAAVAETTVRRNPARNGVEVIFPAKPCLEIRAGLKRLGFRWSRRQGLWYARYNARLWEQVCDLLDVNDREAPTEDLEAGAEDQKALTEDLEANIRDQQAPTEDPEANTKDQQAATENLDSDADDPPWAMTRRAYQESRALRAGGVPILNARDGRDHESAVRQAAVERLPVPPRVLAEYGLEEADVLEVVDVYGRPARISRYDHALGRTQIRLYCQTTATMLSELPITHSARKAQGGTATIHRDNIAQVVDSRGSEHPPETQEQATAVVAEPLQLALSIPS